jgi:hypothetical protein
MKKIFLFIALLTLALFASAQNWRPIHPGEKVNYTIDGSTLYATVWVDSTSSSGSDSIYYFNRIMKKIDSINPGYNYYHINVPNILLEKAFICPDGSYKLKHENLYYYIKPFDTLGASWLFDSLNNVTCQISGIVNASVLGEMDSVKYLKLSTGDSVIISMNHGIVRLPVYDSPGDFIKIYGIDQRNLGFVNPYFRDFFDFTVGDVFEYHTTITDHLYWDHIIEKFTIASKTDTNGLFTYVFNVIRRDIFYNGYNSPYTDTSYSFQPITKTYQNSTHPVVDKNIGQNLYDVTYSYKPVNMGYNAIFSCISKFYPMDNFTFSYLDSTIVQTYYYQYNTITTETFGEGFGRIYYNEYQSHGNGYAHEHEIILAGAWRNGILYGSLTPDGVVAGINKNVKEDLGISLFPNPATNQLSIQAPLNSQIEIFNIEGQCMKSFIAIDTHTTIDISAFARGMYFAKVKTENGTVVKKFVKQ